MYYILLLSSVLCTAILFLICYKKINKTEVIYDDKVSPIVEKLGDNETITNIVLQHVNNYTTKVEKNKDKNQKISFYNVNNDKIVIKDTTDLKDCSRLIQICHECVHSIQDKRILKLHFIFSNINILYFLGTFLYFFYDKRESIRLTLLLIQIFIFIVTFVLKVITESDATYRATIVASDVLKDKLDKDVLNSFIKKVENEIYSIAPIMYFSLYMQGIILLIINQIGAILI